MNDIDEKILLQHNGIYQYFTGVKYVLKDFFMNTETETVSVLLEPLNPNMKTLLLPIDKMSEKVNKNLYPEIEQENLFELYTQQNTGNYALIEVFQGTSEKTYSTKFNYLTDSSGNYIHKEIFNFKTGKDLQKYPNFPDLLNVFLDIARQVSNTEFPPYFIVSFYSEESEQEQFFLEIMTDKDGIDFTIYDHIACGRLYYDKNVNKF